MENILLWKMAANLGTRWGMSLRFILSGSITLISQWTIMLNLIVIKVRRWSCYDVIGLSYRLTRL